MSLASPAIVNIFRALPWPLSYRLDFALSSPTFLRHSNFDASIPFSSSRICSSFIDHNDRNFALHWTNSLAGVVAASVVIRPGDVVYELGANVGTETLALAALVGPTGKVVALEPSPKCFPKLIARLDSNAVKNVVALQVAISAKPQRVNFNEGSSTNSGIGYISSSNDVLIGDTEAVSVESLERYGRPSFVLMDIEGSEVQALLGGATLLSQCRPVIFSELNEVALNRSGNTVGDLCTLMSRNRYELFDAGSRRLRRFQPTSTLKPLYTDLIMIPEERAHLVKRIRRRIWLCKFFPWLLGTRLLVNREPGL